MKKKPNLYAALEATDLKKRGSYPESSSKRYKHLIVQIPLDAHHQLARIKLDLNKKSMKALITEALNDLFIKYNYPPIT